MNRVIKLKAFDKVTKILVNLIGFKDLGNKIELWYWNKENEESYCIADKEYIELVQYTGLKDKNDKEIYEGDILEFTNTYQHMNSSWKCVVKFKFGAFVCVYVNKYEEEVYNKFDSWNFPVVEMKVIGNIYENPELLKE